MIRTWLQKSKSNRLMCALVFSAFALGVPMVSCSAESPEGVGGATHVQGDGGVYTCNEGSTRACYVTIGLHNGVLTCYEGSQTCVGGGWTECGDGTVTNRSYSGSLGTGMRPMALTGSSDCDNPCDPTCQNFEGDPDVVPDPSVGGSFFIEQVGGSVDTLPKGLVYGKGIIEPCEWGAHCQFNHECTNVATHGSCAHSKCEEGPGMSGSCLTADPCVKAICADRASCCGTPCAGHDPCVAGAKLDKACDTCVKTVCDEPGYETCCTAAWTDACVARIAELSAVTGNGCSGKRCECPAGSSRFPDDATGRCYRYGSSNVKYVDAITACNNFATGWNLAKITSSAENGHVKSLISGSDPAWIGLKYASGEWKWEDGETLGYHDWKSPAPTSGCGRVSKLSSGSWDSEDCTKNNKGYVCEGTGTELKPATSASYWDAECIGRVRTVCDATCSTETPLVEDGACKPRPEGVTTCSGIDLSVAVPCDNAIPICNHGATEAPAGIPVVHYPGNSTHYGVCYPPNDPKVKKCSTPAPIPPGKCIWVYPEHCDANSGLGEPSVGSNRQIYVNPTWLPGHVTECSCLDNWSESHRGVPCLDPICATAVADATLKQVNLYLMVDRSYSMGSCTSSSRWTAARNALRSFFASPQLGGINVALEFFPLAIDEAASGDNGCGASNCDATRCAVPLEPLKALQMETAAEGDTHELNLINWVDSLCPVLWANATAHGTPTYPALAGILDAAKTRRAAHPDEIHAVVMVSDGEPTRCNPSNPGSFMFAPTAADEAAIVALATNALNAYTDNRVRTYTVGIGSSGLDLLDDIAVAGGTGFVIEVSDDPAVMETQLVDALLGIATNSVACEFELPDISKYDPNNVTVLYLPGYDKKGNELDAIVFNQSTTGAGGCDWYFDNPANPTKILLCPSRCAEVTANPYAQMSVLLGCPTNFDPVVGTQVYQGTCPPGTRVQWGYMSYQTETPSDSRVEFAVRTASSEPLLVGAFVPVAAAQASPDTQVCAMTPKTATCPIDLYDALGTPVVFNSFIEVQATAYPSSSGHEFPTISDWQITYSCPSTE